MALSQQIDLSAAAQREPADVQARIEALKGRRLYVPIGRAVARLFSTHIGKLPTNKKKWPSTGENAKTAKTVGSRADEGAAVVTVGRVGFRQRLQGGTIKPGPGKKYLAIPARSDSYGKPTGKFSNLVFIKTRRGGMLVEAESQDVSISRTRRKDGSRKVTPGAERGGGVVYWLVPSVTQRGDRGLLPSDAVIEAEVRRIIDMAWRRREGMPSAGGGNVTLHPTGGNR
ncbi:MAG TPA: hypothetical protein VM680_18635 [Verrucomicrobiae bacterium]|nr:hypothetical protein [Verrucomicrobiae bacterium]